MSLKVTREQLQDNISLWLWSKLFAQYSLQVYTSIILFSIKDLSVDLSKDLKLSTEEISLEPS